MSGLLIVFALLAVGKIHGQEAVVSQVTNLRPLHVPAFDRRPVPYQEYNELRTSKPPRLYTNPPRPADLDQPQKANGNGNHNLLPSTVADIQQKRKLFVSSKIPDEVNRPLNIIDPVNNTEYFSNDVYGDITFENSKTPGHDVNPDKWKNTVTVKSDNVTIVKPAFVSIPNNGSVPDVDERSSFNGDPCPAGFAKVNGQCIKADQ